MSEPTFNTIPELIDALGGSLQLARDGDWALGTTSAWKTRAAIPHPHWERIIEIAKGKGIALDAAIILRLHSAQRAMEATG